MRQITFNYLLQDTHDYNCEDQNEDVMVSKIGLTYNEQDFTVEVKQPYGVNFEEEEGFELYIPDNSLLKELNYSLLSEKCELYYRSIIGSNGSGIRIVGGSNIRMRDNKFVQSMQMDIPLSNDSGTTW